VAHITLRVAVVLGHKVEMRLVLHLLALAVMVLLQVLLVLRFTVLVVEVLVI
jgi:hypothetical protein